MSYAIDLAERVAIVTGGGRGIGHAIVRHLAAAGAQVVIADILDAEVVESKLDALGAAGPRPWHLQCDLSLEKNCHQVVADSVERFGKVDILVNNAAIARDSWEDVFALNVLAPFHLNTAAFEDMSKRGYGKIVIVTTSGTYSGGGDGVKYNATKGAADSLTRFQAKRFAGAGVNVNAVAPGPVLTELMKKYYGTDEFSGHYLDQIPLGRLLTEDDMAKVVLFLCSPLSDAMCGETLLVDGGRVRLNP